MAITLSEIKDWRALALRNEGKRGSEIILRLLDELKLAHDEIIQLRLKTADKHGEYDDYTPCPFGKHKGDRLKDVPWDWLLWWISKNTDRDAIILEMDYGAWPKRATAVKKLRLFDYIKKRVKKDGDTLEDHWQGSAA